MVDVTERLVSLPAGSARFHSRNKASRYGGVLFSSDPAKRKLGSGGGTTHLLLQAWKTNGGDLSFTDWLRRSRKMMIHGGGESRRLPAYAAVGKPMLPVPAMRWRRGELLDQTLLDRQLDVCERLLTNAPASTVAIVASGDTLLEFDGALPPFPDVDVLAFGMEVAPEAASDFGVFFTPTEDPRDIACFRQKPSPEEIHSLLDGCRFLVDTGIWFLSEAAITSLLRKSGWNGSHEDDVDYYELYADFGLSLGKTPTKRDAEIEQLSAAVVALPNPEFLHLGTSRQLIESVWSLQNRRSRKAPPGPLGRPGQIVQNARVETAIRRDENHTIWIENSHVPDSWSLEHDHVITGIPDNDWDLAIEAGACVDFTPVGETDWRVRAYGIDDDFRGAVGEAGTEYFGRPISDWFESRGISMKDAGIAVETDIQNAPLFPALALDLIDAQFLNWLIAKEPLVDASMSERWLRAHRLSANAITNDVNLDRWSRQQSENRLSALETIYDSRTASAFYRLDLQSAADQMIASKVAAPATHAVPDDSLEMIHDYMWRSRLRAPISPSDESEYESAAFSCLRRAILGEVGVEASIPVCQIAQGQTIWARSPVRLDLAGGWTDTPPYCILHGGSVANIAVDLNGQPPVQVFAKTTQRREIAIRSIDFGVAERISDYGQLGDYACPGSAFALAKAALVLAGIGGCDAQSGAASHWPSLAEQLKAFGGGIELTLHCEVPAGSGLGTSSILGATILGALNDLCGFGWDRFQISARALALEQMVTTGGGWQDQIGGLFPGLKAISTAPGLDQTPTLDRLPSGLLDQTSPLCPLLYYTGITRTAKNILQEIVKGMFLNESRSLKILRSIAANAMDFAEAARLREMGSLRDCIAETFRLKQALDSQTNPPAVQAIIRQAGDELKVCTILGAGGGGYLLMLPEDADAGLRIKRRLTENPPNPRARFVDMRESLCGVVVTRT